MMKKLALNFMKGLGSVVNFLLLFSLFFIISTTHYAKATFGDVSLPQLLFFTFYGGSDGVESTLVYDVIKNVFVVPCLATVFCLVIWKKTYNGKTLFCSHWFFLLYIAFLAVVSWVLFYKVLYLFEEYDVYRLVALMFGFYLLNLWRNYNLFNIFIVGVFGACLIIYSNYYGEIWRSLFSFKQTDFYEKNFKAIDDVVIKKDVKRNVIVIFAESFENRHAEGMKDDEAVKFSNLTEGFSQNWTQGALFSLFTGVHIHYLSEFFRYGVDGFKFNVNDRVLMATNEIGQSFGFDTPNISYLGDITRANGYNNLFVQGGKLNFSGTDKFLFAHGFLKENVYDMETFKGTEDYEKAIDWWGVSDKNVFQLFKDKLLELEDEKPFFAVMFTLDLHRGFSPFYEKESEQAKATVENLNDFIKWFKEQELNKNTTLIIVGDHKRMGNNVSIGGDVYNAFFNLPDELKKDVNLDRTFNQIDMFATILDIIGVELNEGRAAVGVSVFSKNKTIAERYSYEKQKEIFSKIDRFYQKIWEEKKPLFNVFWEKDKKDVREKFIAHAGGCIDGNVYTNSLEAMEKSKKRGYKYIELDLITTDTPPYNIVATHDCNSFFKMSMKKCDDVIDFDKDKLLNKYSILNEESILRFFRENKNLWLVTDKIDDFSLLSDKFLEIKDRMIVEVFSVKKFREAMVFGFRNIAFNVKNKKDVKTVLENGIKMITISLRTAKNIKDELKILKENKVAILGYSAKNFAEVKDLEDFIDMFYYDGEDNLETFFR